jgi:integrative and conjugative element protein (TIGR02256 family)
VRALLDPRARDFIEREALKRRLLETGGGLFGWEAEDGDLVLACASGPGEQAKHRPRSFRPSRATTGYAMRTVREFSEKRYQYVGSWHSHPLAAAAPSSIDRGTAVDMAEQQDLLLPRPLLLIVGTTGTARRLRVREVRAWRWTPATGSLSELAVEDYELEKRYCPTGELFG